MAVKIQLRRGTAAEWLAEDPLVLMEGEVGIVTDGPYFKIGDGVTDFEDLPLAGRTVAELLDGSQLRGYSETTITIDDDDDDDNIMTLDLSLANVFVVDLATFGDDVEIAVDVPPGADLNYSYTVYIIQGDPARAVTWASGIEFVDDNVPDLDTVGGVYIITGTTIDAGVNIDQAYVGMRGGA